MAPTKFFVQGICDTCLALVTPPLLYRLSPLCTVAVTWSRLRRQPGRQGVVHSVTPSCFAWSRPRHAGCCCCCCCVHRPQLIPGVYFSPPSSRCSTRRHLAVHHFHVAIRLANPWRHFRLMRVTWLAGLIIFPSVRIISGVFSDNGSVITSTSCRQNQPHTPVIDHFYAFSSCNFSIWRNFGAPFM